MSVFIRWCILLSCLVISTSLLSAGGLPQNPIMFVTVVPMCEDSATQCSVLSSHLAGYNNVLRGGDLYIRYPDGTLKNLTRAAGYGSSMLQDLSSIAVRQPCVHWSGKKAVFSMVQSTTLSHNDKRKFYWQLFEISGLGKDEQPVISELPNQPKANNINPIYGTDDRIIFTSDRAIEGDTTTMGYRDESLGMMCVSGVWSLHPGTGELRQLSHSPSGANNLSIDSYGRLLFCQWDFLQQDMTVSNSNHKITSSLGSDDGFTSFPQGFFTTKLDTVQRKIHTYYGADLTVTAIENAKRVITGDDGIDHHLPSNFFPWEMSEDGQSMQTLNHIGRHDLLDSIPANDSTLVNFSASNSGRKNKNSIVNVFQLREDPLNPGTYLAIDAPVALTHSAGQIIRLRNCKPSDASRDVEVDYLTPRVTRNLSFASTPNLSEHSGMYRNPLFTTDGVLVASHSANSQPDNRTGVPDARSKFHFRLRTMKFNGKVYEPGEYLTNGISCDVSYVNPRSSFDDIIDIHESYWEMDAVEVVARPRPQAQKSDLGKIEREVFEQENVSLDTFTTYMRLHRLALLISRDLRQRDPQDKQQAFSLELEEDRQRLHDDSAKKRLIARFEVFEANPARTYKKDGVQLNGCRSIAVPIFSSLIGGSATEVRFKQVLPTSVPIEDDGSVALFVPAKRALSWQTSFTGEAVVCERYWVNFANGEIRTCARCHGENDRATALSQAMPTNSPKALRGLLHQWKANNCAQTVVAISPLSATVPQVYPVKLLWKTDSNALSYDVTLRCATCSDKQVVLHRVLDKSQSSILIDAKDIDTTIKDFEWQVSAQGRWCSTDSVTTQTFTTRKPDIVNDVDLSSIQDFLINPQPAHDALRIRGSLLQPDNLTIVLRNVLGAEIKKTEILTQGLIFDANIFVQDVPSGIYQVCMVTTTGERRRPIVITH